MIMSKQSNIIRYGLEDEVDELLKDNSAYRVAKIISERHPKHKITGSSVRRYIKALEQKGIEPLAPNRFLNDAIVRILEDHSFAGY